MRNIILYMLCSFIYAINFSEDISPIIYNNCTSCHRPNEIGAFLPLENFDDIYNNRSLITYVIGGDDETRHNNPIMPPWPPNREYSTLLYERYLEDYEIDLIIDWVNEGAVQGDPSLEYPMPNFPEGSDLGQADLILEMEEPFYVEGNYEDDYRCFVFSLDNQEELEMSAIEFRPGNREAVHHAIITYVPHGAADYLENQDNQYGYDCYGGFNLNTSTDLIGGYAPGLSPIEYPGNIGRTIPQNSDIIVQIHYAPLMTDAQDLSSINLFIKDQTIDREIEQEIFDYWEYALPPNQETTITRNLNIGNQSISLVNILPHAHLLGKSWEIYATTIQGEIISIIKIDNWDFDWQGFYYPEFLLKIPAGSTITATCIYDNTSENPNNPNSPPQWVYPGQGTGDSMFFIPIEYLIYQDGDEDIYLGIIDNCSLVGDINGDNGLNVLDVVLLVNSILDNLETNCSDLNSDEIINILDIVLLIEIILE
jgi:hypothetical protein